MKKSKKVDIKDVRWFLKKDLIESIDTIENAIKLNQKVKNVYTWSLVYTNQDWSENWVIDKEQCFLITINKIEDRYYIDACGNGNIIFRLNNLAYDVAEGIFKKIKDFTSWNDLEELGFELLKEEK